MIQPANFAHINKIKRRYESQREASPIKELENIAMYVDEKIRGLPTKCAGFANYQDNCSYITNYCVSR